MEHRSLKVRIAGEPCTAEGRFRPKHGSRHLQFSLEAGLREVRFARERSSGEVSFTLGFHPYEVRRALEYGLIKPCRPMEVCVFEICHGPECGKAEERRLEKGRV